MRCCSVRPWWTVATEISLELVYLATNRSRLCYAEQRHSRLFPAQRRSTNRNYSAPRQLSLIHSVYLHQLNVTKPVVIYCLPVQSLGDFLPQAYRFVASWLECQPLHDCSLFVISNGGEPSSEAQLLFSAIPSFQGFLERGNEGFDIGAFQFAAQNIAGEMHVYFGTNAYFRRAGWLYRMVEAWNSAGPQFYGAFASLVSRPHIRTTGFWTSPELMNRYPRRVTTLQQRYDAEHRDMNLTDWVETVGHRALMVTWSGLYGRNFWGQVLNAYMSGDQSECLIRDRISDQFCP